MPRTPAHFTQADIARALRAFRSLGIEAQVRIPPEGGIVIEPTPRDAGKSNLDGKDINSWDRTDRLPKSEVQTWQPTPGSKTAGMFEVGAKGSYGKERFDFERNEHLSPIESQAQEKER